MLHVEKFQPGFQSYDVIFYFKSKKGQFDFAQTSLPIESKGESRAARLATSNARAGNSALVSGLASEGSMFCQLRKLLGNPS